MTAMVSRDDTFEVQSVGGHKPRSVSRYMLCEIIEPRSRNLPARQAPKLDEDRLLRGSRHERHDPTRCSSCFDLPVRRGLPIGITGLVRVVKSPMYSTGVGLVLYGGKK